MTAKGAVAAVAALVMSPALAAGYYASTAPGHASGLYSIMGDFTPASADPRLVAQLAALPQTARDHFRFTPAVASGNGERQLTIVVRASLPQTGAVVPSGALASAADVAGRMASPVAIAPVAYNLGTKVGMDHFSIPAAAPAKPTLDLVGAASPRFQLDKASDTPSRLNSTLKVEAAQDVAATDRPLDGRHAVTVDLGSSYRLTRKLSVTAGVRYKQDDEPLQTLTDSRRDNQAVYIGTKVRF